MPFSLRRRIYITAERLVIDDIIYGEGKLGLRSITPCEDATVVHSASTRYLAPGHWAANNSDLQTGEWVEVLNRRGRIHLERELLVQGEAGTIRLREED